MGGAFGGKVTRPCQIAAGAALAAWKLGRKVHLAVTRDDDLRMNGGPRQLSACLPPFISLTCCSELEAVRHQVGLHVSLIGSTMLVCRGELRWWGHMAVACQLNAGPAIAGTA